MKTIYKMLIDLILGFFAYDAEVFEFEDFVSIGLDENETIAQDVIDILNDHDMIWSMKRINGVMWLIFGV